MANIKSIFFALFFLFCPKSYGETIGIGSKMFTENIILAEMLAQILESKYDVRVDRRFNLGGTNVAFEAMLSKSIDVYPEYTGTGYSLILNASGLKNSKEILNFTRSQFLEKYQIDWSKPLGFNNTYALAVRKSDPRFKGFTKISEIKDLSKSLEFISAHEFMERADGFSSLVRVYDLDFKKENTRTFDPGLVYKALKDKDADIAVTYSTDGRVLAFDLKLLKDDLNFFPPYEAAFIFSTLALKKSEHLKQAIGLLEGQIRDDEIIQLNDKVDRLKQDLPTVVKNFLVSKQLLQGDIQETSNSQSFWGFLIQKQTYFFKIFLQHINLTLITLLASITISLPLGIWATRKPSLAKMIFPVLNTIQTIPGLALLGFLIPLVGIGLVPTLIALFLYSLLPLVRNTYEGIQGVDPKHIEASTGMGLTPWQVLLQVEIPLAMPIIFAGIRTSAVIIVGTATLAALVGAGGLGEPIFRGVATVNSNLILLGAIPSALLAILIDRILSVAERFFVSPGLRLTQ